MQPVTFSPSDICSFIFQSKEIGLQMHEELLKVTNELYTVSPAEALLLFGIGSSFFSTRSQRESKPETWNDCGHFCSVCAPMTGSHHGGL